MRKILGGAAVIVVGLTSAGVPAAGAGEPNCVEFFPVGEIANHGEHIVGAYVIGTGHGGDWPPSGRVGDIVGGRGALKPGESGILNHGASPGASFCNGSSSPTSPPGRG